MLERWHIGLLVVATLIAVASITSIWEFGIEDRMEPGSFAVDDMESFEEKVEDMIEVTLFSGLALIVPTIMLFRIRSKVLESVERERAANRAKTEFLSIISHELRTPLASVRGSIGVLQGDLLDSPEERKRAFDIAIRNCERLTDLVNDAVDVARIEQHQLKLNVKPLEAASLIASAIDLNLDHARMGGCTLEAAREISPARVLADEARLMQVFTNLISNAVKYGGAGTITLDAKSAGSWVQFTVSDNGPGVSLEDAEKIFQQFGQLDNTDARSQEGVGLGLFISKSIIKAQDGRMGVIPTPGLGATFYFELPTVIQQ